MSQRRNRLGFRKVALASLGVSSLLLACSWDPSKPFERDAPAVREALRHYEAGASDAAAMLLQDYLTTGPCSEGNIGTPPRVRERPNGSFDLGLALFSIAESFGRRFGEEEVDAGDGSAHGAGPRGGMVDCALRITRAVAEDRSQPPHLRARARFLEGNLLFLTAAYKEAVTAYDRSLEFMPAMGDAGPIGASADAGTTPYAVDGIGRDAAWNRAIALRRIEDKKDAGPDASPPDASGEGGSREPSDGGNDEKTPDAGQEPKDGGGSEPPKDAGRDAQGKDEDRPKDAGADANEPEPPSSQPPPPSRQSQDDRILDQLENAPTVQQEAAKKQGRARRVRGMADK